MPDFNGTPGDDTLTGIDGTDNITGGGGNDVIGRPRAAGYFHLFRQLRRISD